jgi:VanZ family protein
MVKKNILSSVIALAILFLSFTGPGTFNKLNIPDIPHLDKMAHAVMYFVLMSALIFENRTLLTSAKKYLILSTIPVVFGTVIEFLQSLFTSNRTGDFFDVCFNILGVSLAILIWILFKRIRNSLTK